MIVACLSATNNAITIPHPKRKNSQDWVELLSQAKTHGNIYAATGGIIRLRMIFSKESPLGYAGESCEGKEGEGTNGVH
jgi:hypothetical protein